MAKQTTYIPYVTNYDKDVKSFTNVRYNSSAPNITISSSKDANNRRIQTIIEWSRYSWRFQLKGTNMMYSGTPTDAHHITDRHDPGSGTKTANLYLSMSGETVYRDNYMTGSSIYNIIRTNTKFNWGNYPLAAQPTSETASWKPYGSNFNNPSNGRSLYITSDDSNFLGLSTDRLTRQIWTKVDERPWAFFQEDIEDNIIYLDLNVELPSSADPIYNDSFFSEERGNILLPEGWDKSKRVWVSSGTGSYIDVGYFGSSNIIPFTVQNFRTPGYTDVHLFNLVVPDKENAWRHYTQDDTEARTRVAYGGDNSSANDGYATIHIPSKTYRIERKIHSTPTLNRTGKVLSWSSDDNVTEDWELQWSNQSNFSGINTINLPPLQNSYTIPNHLYYTNAGTTRYWRLRKRTNKKIIQTEEKQWRKDFSTDGELRQGYDRTVATMYFYSDWSSSISTNIRVPNVTSVSGIISLESIRRGSWSWNHSSESAVTRYEYSYDGSTWAEFSYDKPTSFLTYPYETIGYKSFYIRSVLIDEGYTLYSNTTSRTINLKPLDDPSELSWSATRGTRTGINTYSAQWNQFGIWGSEDDMAIQYRQYVGTTPITDQSQVIWTSHSQLNIPISLVNLRYATNTVRARAVLLVDGVVNESFSSNSSDPDSWGIVDNLTLTTTHLPKIAKPNLSKTAITTTKNIAGTNRTLQLGIRLEATVPSGQSGAGYVFKQVRDYSGGIVTTLIPAEGYQSSRTHTESIPDDDVTIYPVGDYDYSVQAVSGIVYDGIPYTDFDSPWSDIVEDVVQGMDPPVLTFKDENTDPDKHRQDIVLISKPEEADYVDFRMIPDTSTPDITQLTTGTSLQLRTLTGATTVPGDYNVFAYSMSFDRFHKNGSIDSNHLSYETIKLGTPQNVTWNADDQKLTWSAVTNANWYKVYEKISGNNIIVEETSDLETTVLFDTGVHELWVVATNRRMVDIDSEMVDYNEYSNPRYINSNESTHVSFGTLPTPDPLIRIDNTLHWSTSEGADYYELWLNDEEEPYKILYTTFETLSNKVDGTFSWKVRAVKPGNPELISGFTNTVTYTIEKILPPVLEFNPNTMETFWNQPTNATEYDLKIDGKIETTITEANRPTTVDPYIIPRTGEGDYYISVEAKNTGEDPFLYPRSIASNVEVYSIFKIATPIITYNPADTEINWDAIPDANQYTIHLRENGGSYNDNYATTIDNEWDTTPLPAGTYAVKIHATQNGQAINVNPLYIESNISNEIQFGTLAKPVISLDGSFIVWDEVDFADYYEIFNYDEKIAEITANEFNITSLEAKTYRYTVRARSNQSVQIGGNIDDTDTLSNAVTVTFFQLATPALSILDGGTLSWQSVPFATSYEIYLNNALKTTVDSSTTTYFIEPELIPGRNIMYIRAVSDLFNYIDSGYSNNVNYLKVVKYHYTAIIDGEEYNCWLPFTVQEVLDGSIATGSIILEPINKATPFEKDTPVSFYVYSDDERKVPYHEWHMLVDSDTVEEFQIGTKALWKHRIDLIGKEKLLQYDYLTFSISQTRSYIDARYTSIVSKNLNAQVAGGAKLLPNNFKYTGEGSIFDDPSSGYMPSAISSTEHNFVIPTMFNTAYRMSDGVKLYDAPEDPKWIIKYIKWERQNSLLGLLLGGTMVNKTYEVPLKWRWKWRNHTTGLEYDPAFPETVIVPDANNMWRPTNLGTYDLIMEIIPHNLTNIGGSAPDYISTPNLSPFYTGDLTRTTLGMKANNSWANIRNQLVTGRIVFPGIEISEILENVKEYIPGRKTVGDAIRKALNLVELTSYPDANKPESQIAATKWRVSKESLQIADQIDCPDLVFENKNLFEILLELGKLFQGIPKLSRADNIIDFKIIDQMDTNDAFVDTEELMNVSSPLPQYSNAYISDVKNMLTEDNMLVFPGGDLWTRTSTGDSSGIVSAMNSVIKLPFPIKKILDVRVRNVLRNRSTEISIINFIKEKTVYDSLTLSNVEGDVNSKAYNIYYREGSNTIEGLGVIPAQTEINKTLGLSETNYVIENILGYLTGATKEQDVQSFEFKVYYEPMIDTKVLVEKPNIAGFRNKSVKNLNQSESMISDTMFAQGSQRILSRLANKFITKTYRQQHYSLTPRLGQTIEFEGVKYYADIINISYYNTYADIKVNYSEKINKLNERMKPDASYRAYNIENKGYVKRDLRQDEYVYITRQDYTDYPYPENAGNKIRIMNGPVRDVYLGLVKGTPLFAPNYLTINNTTKDSISTPYKYKTAKIVPEGNPPEEKNLPNAALPLNKNFLGNSILFSAQAESNYSYGKRISGEQEIDLGMWQDDALQLVFKVDNYRRNFQTDVRYVDNDGENESMMLSYIRINSPMSLSLPIKDYKGDSINTLPEIRNDYRYNNIPTNDRLFEKHVYVQKDMRELLRFQYQLHFQTFDKNLHISPHISKQIYKEVLPTYRQQPEINAPKWVLFRGDIKNNPTLHNIKIKELTIPNVSQTVMSLLDAKNHITIGPDTFSGTIEGDWDGYMLMRPDSKMYIMAYYKPIEAGTYGPGELTDKWTLRFSPFKLDYKEY